MQEKSDYAKTYQHISLGYILVESSICRFQGINDSLVNMVLDVGCDVK